MSADAAAASASPHHQVIWAVRRSILLEFSAADQSLPPVKFNPRSEAAVPQLDSGSVTAFLKRADRLLGSVVGLINAPGQRDSISAADPPQRAWATAVLVHAVR